VKVSEYNTVKSQISAALRKQGGSLAVRDISNLVKPNQLIDSENLTTLFVVVSKYSVKDWEATYEKLCDFVVSKMGREAVQKQQPKQIVGYCGIVTHG
jgi:V-type H+-transporting ATPase subunit C